MSNCQPETPNGAAWWRDGPTACTSLTPVYTYCGDRRANAYPGPPGHPSWVDNANGTAALCGRKCTTWHGSEKRCVAFEANIPNGNLSEAACYLFLGTIQDPFVPLQYPLPSTVTTCIIDGFKPPPPPPPPPQRGKTSGHTFPRLSNCW